MGSSDGRKPSCWVNREELEILQKENQDLKALYIRVAKKQSELGKKELADYMLAQIEATPTFTTWEKYVTWVDKEDIRKKIEEIKGQKDLINGAYFVEVLEDLIRGDKNED